MENPMSKRPRRLRQSSGVRRLLVQSRLHCEDLIAPVFVVEGHAVKREIAAMPGQYHWSVDRLPEWVNAVRQAGLAAVIVFGVPAACDAGGTGSYADNGITQQAVRCIKTLAPELVVFTDVCLCSFTSHGHCGLIDAAGNVLNDETLPVLADIACSHARAGADFVAPSGMMDGMVAAIRQGLDRCGYYNVGILSYTVKYASNFYGPFREACGTALKGDRQTYQLSYRAAPKEALREAELDEQEGADMLMVKPGGPYLDIVQTLAQQTQLPMAAYQVSGEYGMLKAAAQAGWLDEPAAVLESLYALKRSGAALIVSYYALEVARWLDASA